MNINRPTKFILNSDLIFVCIDLNGTAGANPFGIDIRVKFLLNTVINCVLKNSREDAHISYDRVIYSLFNPFSESSGLSTHFRL